MEFGGVASDNFQAEDIMIVFPHIEHYFIPHSTGVEIVQLEFSSDLFIMIANDLQAENTFQYELLRSNHMYMKIVNQNAIANAILSLVRELTEKQTSYEQLTLTYYTELLLLLTRYLNTLIKSTRHKLMNDILEYINNSYINDIATASIATQFNISERYVRKLFAYYANTSLINYINDLRIKKAKELLKYTAHSVKEVSYLAGFKSPEYFIKVFKQFTKLSPRQFKNNFTVEQHLAQNYASDTD